MNDLQIAKKIQGWWLDAKADCRTFIERWVQIEDRDVSGLAIPFKLWEKQIEALNAFIGDRLIVVLKARQLGLTWLALSYAAWKMIFTPGFSVVALSQKETPDAKELVRRVVFILRHLPKWITIEKSQAPPLYPRPTWEATTLTVTISHAGAEPSTFLAMASAPGAGRSFTASLVILDEWAFQEYAKEIYSAAYPTINRPTGGQVIGLSTAKRGTLFEEICLKARAGLNNFILVFLPWFADPRRTKEWYEKTKQDLPNTYKSEYPATFEEAWSVGEGAFFEEWNEDVHVLKNWRPPKEWKRVRAYDPGFSSYACMKWYALSPDGWAVCYREYYPHRVTDKEQAAEIKRLSKHDDGTPEEIEYTVADTDAWTPSRDSGQSTAEVFALEGIPLRQATKDLENGWRRLHEWLKPYKGPDEGMMAHLRFTKDCLNTIRTYPACEQSKTNPEDISKDSEHHCFIAGTMIATPNGEISIESVRPGDLVLTRQGAKPVVACGITGTKIPLLTVLLSNGANLTGTRSHPIWVRGRGFVPLSDLRAGDILETAEGCGWREKAFDSTEAHTPATSTLPIAQIGCISVPVRITGPVISIATSGLRTMARFRRAITFIIRTATRSTTPSRILSVFRGLTTSRITANCGPSIPSRFGGQSPLLHCGTSLPKGASGTLNMEGASLRADRSYSAHAPIVGSNDLPRGVSGVIGSAQTTASQPTAGVSISTTRREPAWYAARRLSRTNTQESRPAAKSALQVRGICPAGIGTVYNITVDQAPEYYANGVLVHNCQDVDRYFTMSRPRPFEERVLKFPDSMTEEQKKQAIKNMEFEQWYQKMKERR